MQRYSYRNKKTGKTVQSDKPLNDPNLVLISKVADTRMKSAEVRQKGSESEERRRKVMHTN